MVQKRQTGHGDTIIPWRVSSNEEGNYKTNVPINATLIGAATTTFGTIGTILRSLFNESTTIFRVISICGLVTSVIQVPLVLACTIKHHKKTSKINPVVPKTLQFHEDEHDCDNISNGATDKTAENDGHLIVTHDEVFEHVENVDKADQNSVGENTVSRVVSNEHIKLTEIGQLPCEVGHM